MTNISEGEKPKVTDEVFKKGLAEAKRVKDDARELPREGQDWYVVPGGDRVKYWKEMGRVKSISAAIAADLTNKPING